MSVSIKTPPKLNGLSNKVSSGMFGAGVGTALCSLILWVIGAWIVGDWTAAHVENALAAVPWPVSGTVLVVFAAIGSGIPGWYVADPVRTVGIAQLAADPNVAAVAKDVTSTSVDTPVDNSQDSAPVDNSASEQFRYDTSYDPSTLPTDDPNNYPEDNSTAFPQGAVDQPDDTFTDDMPADESAPGGDTPTSPPQ